MQAEAKIDPQSVVRRVWAEVWNAHDASKIDQLFAPTFRMNQGRQVFIDGRVAWRAFVADYLRSVPDYHIDIDLMFGDGRHVASVWRCTGTHGGPLFGLPATGKQFALTGTTVFRVENGAITEGWLQRDVEATVKALRAQVP